MATTLKIVNELFEETIEDISQDSNSWQSFLKCASMNYKYNFSDQLLIYAQKPNAIACADLDTWNKTLKRWINKGAKGIALLTDVNGYPRIRYVFDVSDTHSKYNKKVALWTVNNAYEEQLIESLENKYGELTDKSNIITTLKSVANNLVEDNYIDYFNDFTDNKIGTRLENINNAVIEDNYKKLLKNSVAFMLINRCGYNSSSSFVATDFIEIPIFKDMDNIVRLGSAISDISEMGLREIYNILKNIRINEIDKICTFDKKDNLVYDNSEKEKGAERRDINEHNLQEDRQLPITKSISERGQETNSREVFNDEITIFEREQESVVPNNVDERHINNSFRGDRIDSTKEIINNNETNANRIEYQRGDESYQSDGMGRINEQHKEISRRNYNDRIDIQLDNYDLSKRKSYVVLDRHINQILSNTTKLKISNEEIKEFFNNEKNIYKRGEYLKEIFNYEYTDIVVNDQVYGYKAYNNGILFWKGIFDLRDTETFVSWENLTYHYDSMILLKQLDKKEDNSIPDIEFTDEFVDKYLIEVSTRKKLDIYKYFQNGSSTSDNIKHLKEIYGIGGEGYILKGSGIAIDYDSKGITFYRGYEGVDAVQKLFQWNYIEKRIKALIREEKYLNTEELKKLVDNDDYKYQYKVGDKVSIGLDEYEITKIGIFDVELYDPKYPLFGRTMNKVEFETKLKENPSNEHLRVEENENKEEVIIETITKVEDIEDDKAYTVARVISDKNCVELHFHCGEAYIEIGKKNNDNSWDNVVEDIEWFDKSLSDNEILGILEKIYDDNFDETPIITFEEKDYSKEDKFIEKILSIHKINDINVNVNHRNEIVAYDDENSWVGSELYDFLFNEVFVYNEDGKVELLSDEDFERLQNYRKQYNGEIIVEYKEIDFYKELHKIYIDELGKADYQFDINSVISSVYINDDNKLNYQQYLVYLLEKLREVGNVPDIYIDRINKDLDVVREKQKEIIGREVKYDDGIYIIQDILEDNDDYNIGDTVALKNKETGKTTVDTLDYINFILDNNKVELTEKEKDDIKQAKKVVDLFNAKKEELQKQATSQLSLFLSREQELADTFNDLFNSFDTKWKDTFYIKDIELKKWDHIKSKKRNLSIMIKSNKCLGFDENSFTQFNNDKTDEIKLREQLENSNLFKYLSKDKDFSISITPDTIFIHYHNFDDKQIDLSVEKEEILTSINDIENIEIIDDGEIKKEIKAKKKPREKEVNYILYPEIPYEDRINYKINNNDLGVGTEGERFRNNINAIKVLKKCEEENRYATPEEQEILSKYVGWGGLSRAFKNGDMWQEELKAVLNNEDDYDSAYDTVLTAFYTPPVVIKAMYKALSNMGLKKGNILEPSCGIGHFIGMLPNNDDLKIYGVEKDNISGRIARQLYQKSSIAIKGFEDVKYSDSFFDVAIGNVPFGNFPVVDKKYDKNNFLIHDYFFAKTIDKVRPGGIIAFVTSQGTMDKKNPSVRKYIAQRADLLGAIRLPNDTFTKNAGTKVTTDIIFLQKRDSITDIMPSWVDVEVSENGVPINSYYIDNPDKVLGEYKFVPGPNGPTPTCVPFENADLEELLDNAISNIYAEIKDYQIEENEEDIDLSIEADLNVDNFSYTIVDDKIYYRENSRMYPQEFALTTENRVKGLIEIRNCTRELINLQLEDYPDSEIERTQKKLNELYDNFTKKYGLINSRPNATAFSNDNSYYLLCSLEILDENGNLSRKADIFSKRTIQAHKQPKSINNSNDALIFSISEKAKVDLDFMSEVSKIPKEQLIKDLEGLIFKIPTEGKYVTADEYLSGNVREKLRDAETANLLEPIYDINIKYLKESLPKDLNATEINVRIGTTWIPKEDYQEFMQYLFDMDYYAKRKIKINYSDIRNEWYIDNKSYDNHNEKVISTYGTKRINGYNILEDTLNLKDVKIYDYIEEDGKLRRVLNGKETAIAQAKQELIKQAFLEWIWKDPERRIRLEKIYNELFNSIKPREYDGSYIKFDGMNPEFTLRKHQVNAIARILYGGNTLLAHEVGAGKTFEMVAGAMESKRLGLCNKSLFVVPNHIIEQFASEFLQLYPSANLLVATKKDFETANRKKFCSRIATGEYDAVIIGHSQFEKIPMSIQRQINLLKNEVRDITDGIEDAKRTGASFTVKQLAKTKKMIETKLNKLINQEKKDKNVVTFEQLGVDRLFVDEAHYYKNLYLYTKMNNVSGISQTEAQKSTDLYMKCQYLDEITDCKGVIFATGTPISNSMVELYTMQRYLQSNTLHKLGIQNFDAWASTFGETVTAIELAPEGNGYRSKTRFAKFFNLPELIALFKEFADVQTADMLKLPVPEAVYETVVLKPSDIQLKMVEELGVRAEAIRKGNVNPHIDNMLKITGDSKKLSLDQRIMNSLLPDYENSKVNVCADNIFKLYNEYAEDKAAQLVFCDSSTPKEDGSFNIYDDLKQKLIDRGIPSEEIAFIHSADNEAKKKELFSKVRKGQVRVLIGSTQKMGAGTNVQDRLIALHDLDCPWRPSDLTQRSGRIIRQGNMFKKVYIYRYVVEKTFDAYLYQLIENKQKFISQIMTSRTPLRSATDVDETVLSYAEIKALAAGNPLILEKTELESKVSKLKLLKQSHLSQIYELQDKVLKVYPRDIKELETRIDNLEKDIKIVEENTVSLDTFSGMTINGINYVEKKDAGNAILEFIKQNKNIEKEVDLGSYKGFDMKLGFSILGKNFYVSLVNNETYSAPLGTDPLGNITRIDNVLDRLTVYLENNTNKLETTKQQFEVAKEEIKRPFPQEDELKEAIKKLKEVDIALKIDEKVPDVIDYEEEKQDSQGYKEEYAR